MKIKRQTLAEVIDRLAKKVPAKKLANEVAAYLLSEGRTKELDALMRDITQLRARSGIIETEVEIAHELNSGLSGSVKSVIKKLHPNAKQIIINKSINPELIGGVKISLPEEQLDTSIRGKLNKMRQIAGGVN